MELINYGLMVGKKELISNVNLKFEKGIINHLLGANGVGKSCFAKSCAGLVPFSGSIIIDNVPTLISSYSNIPMDLRFKDVLCILKKKYDTNIINDLSKTLNVENIPPHVILRKLSDGQRQKVKLLSFLVAQPKCIILDEFTSALDKIVSFEMYAFFNKYVNTNSVTCINITHNLSDIEHMPGRYYLLDNQQIIFFQRKEEMVSRYIKGGEQIWN